MEKMFLQKVLTLYGVDCPVSLNSKCDVDILKRGMFSLRIVGSQGPVKGRIDIRNKKLPRFDMNIQ